MYGASTHVHSSMYSALECSPSCCSSTKYSELTFFTFSLSFFTLSSFFALLTVLLCEPPLLFSVCSSFHLSPSFFSHSYLFPCLWQPSSSSSHCPVRLLPSPPPAPPFLFSPVIGFPSPLVSRGERQRVPADSSDQSRAAGLPSHC